MECLTCKSNSGEQRISPGPTIFEGEYWFVEHANPVKQPGWKVILFKRHAEALHELSAKEFAKHAELPEEPKGGKSFNLLKVFGEVALPSFEITAFCEMLQIKFQQPGM